MRLLIAWLHRRLRREPARTPVRRSGLMFDPTFTRASFRQGEPADPLSALVEE